MRYQLTGLNCNNCALKIEQELKKVTGLETAHINFANQSMHIPPEHLEKAREVISRLEPEVRILPPLDTSEAAATFETTAPRKELYAIAIALLLFSGGLIFNTALSQTAFSWAEYLVFLSAYFIVGWPVLRQAGRNLVRRQFFDENLLMTIASLGAIAIHQLAEAVAVMLFYAIGEYFQDRAVNRSRRSIKALLQVRPDYANLSVDGEISKVAPEAVAVGQTIIVKPGEKIPLDGEVIEGESFVDTAALTGESRPRHVSGGKKVLAGMVNGQGLLTVKVSRPFSDSSVAKVMELVEQAAARKAPTERFITTFARYYTPAVICAALGLAFIPPLLVPGTTFSAWIYRALVLLVISCPCALVISVPLGYFAGLGSASRQGILIKGANFLEALANLTTVVFDKTGTLTRGVFKVTQVEAVNGFNKDEVLALAAAAEAYSNHPIAQSIRQAWGAEIAAEQISAYQELPGKGISAVIAGKRVLVGNRLICPHLTIPSDPPAGTCIHVVVDDVYAGWLLITDEIKPDARNTIVNLKRLSIKQTLMLSGDASNVAQDVADKLGLDNYYAELLPEDKVQKIEALRLAFTNPRKQKLAFVGDGINDAPVLARADIGVAMGALGADAAIEAADVVLMDDNPAKLVTAVKIARYTRQIIRQNIILAIGLKIFIMSLGIFGLAGIWEAVFADVGVALIAILNASRVLKYKGS
ncbi:MAG: cadmium-translocating P-type ATPase [Clostridia bacterium]|nr:cadmium-translocating P-type ATPase [Clostridia bacterium]